MDIIYFHWFPITSLYFVFFYRKTKQNKRKISKKWSSSFLLSSAICCCLLNFLDELKSHSGANSQTFNVHLCTTLPFMLAPVFDVYIFQMRTSIPDTEIINQRNQHTQSLTHSFTPNTHNNIQSNRYWNIIMIITKRHSTYEDR